MWDGVAKGWTGHFARSSFLVDMVAIDDGACHTSWSGVGGSQGQRDSQHWEQAYCGYSEAGQSWVPLRTAYRHSSNLFHVLSPNALVLLLSCTYILHPLSIAFLLIAQFIIRKGYHIAPVRTNASLLWPAVVLASLVQNFHRSWVESVCICLRSMYNCWKSHMQAARCTMSVPGAVMTSPFPLGNLTYSWWPVSRTRSLAASVITRISSATIQADDYGICILRRLSFVPVMTLVSASFWRSCCLLSIDNTPEVPFPSKIITVMFGLLNCPSLFQHNSSNLWRAKR